MIADAALYAWSLLWRQLPNEVSISLTLTSLPVSSSEFFGMKEAATLLASELFAVGYKNTNICCRLPCSQFQSARWHICTLNDALGDSCKVLLVLSVCCLEVCLVMITCCTYCTSVSLSGKLASPASKKLCLPAHQLSHMRAAA